eukprot:764685-Hanusia_phi.AAC.6
MGCRACDWDGCQDCYDKDRLPSTLLSNPLSPPPAPSSQGGERRARQGEPLLVQEARREPCSGMISLEHQLVPG